MSEETNADEGGRQEVLGFLQRCGVAAERLADLGPLRRLFAALVEANRMANLTRITDEDDYWVLHVADSLSVGLVMPELLREPLTVADVGCGAGFPLLALAWANPAVRITGIEPRQKPAAFVRRQIEAMGLTNCCVLARQAREAGRLPEHAGRYDVVLARAVGPAGKLLRDARRLLRAAPEARMVLYKTPAAIAQERSLAAREAAKFALDLTTPEAFDLPRGRGRRQFLVARRRERQ